MSELKIRLEQHAMWLLDQSKGARFVAAYGENLSSANLRSADLSYADLRSANLRSANLSSADLRSADLRSANLSSADLSSANLSSANLSSIYGFNFKPLQIINTKYFVTIFDDHVIWGCRKLTFDELNEFELENCTSSWDKDEFKLNKKIIMEMIRYYRMSK